MLGHMFTFLKAKLEDQEENSRDMNDASVCFRLSDTIHNTHACASEYKYLPLVSSTYIVHTC